MQIKNNCSQRDVAKQDNKWKILKKTKQTNNKKTVLLLEYKLKTKITQEELNQTLQKLGTKFYHVIPKH